MNKKMTRIIGVVAIAAAAAMIGTGVWMMNDTSEETVMTPNTNVMVGEMDDATACQKLLSTYYQSIVNQNSQQLYQLMAPPEYWSYYQAHYDKSTADIITTYDDAIQNTLSEWEKSCGDHVKVAFHIEASSEKTEDFLTEWSDSMNSVIGENVLTAQKALTLQVTQTISGDSGTKESTTMPTLIQVNDTWYILDEGVNTQ